MNVSDLYVPPDLDEAAERWGANCGPGALAALTGRPLAQILSYMPDFPERGYTNPTHAIRALGQMGWNYDSGGEDFVGRGLAFVQWCGPWDHGTANARWAYRYTHWLAFSQCGWDAIAVYDVNVEPAGGWCWYDQWAERVAPTLLPKRSTGHRIRKYISAWPEDSAAEGAEE